jgi:hypothetical protein
MVLAFGEWLMVDGVPITGESKAIVILRDGTQLWLAKVWNELCALCHCEARHEPWQSLSREKIAAVA